MTLTTKDAATTPLLRLPDVLAMFPISRSSWYEGVRTGRYPPPVKLGARTVAWRRADLEALLERLGDGEGESVAPMLAAFGVPS